MDTRLLFSFSLNKIRVKLASRFTINIYLNFRKLNKKKMKWASDLIHEVKKYLKKNVNDL